MKRNIEVLAPAGSYETLKAAIASGADAVYVGGSRFGARAYAQNFTEEELLEAIDYVHLRGKKIFLTVNTLIKEKEFKDLYSYLLPFYKHGLDAVIVQDMGVLDYIRKQFPDIDIHASTQMTITNSISAEYLEKIGVRRVVPARELSLNEIKEIAHKTDMEIECFVHGALCYCYSGQCLLSSMIGGRSGNRGQCAQPCRLPYKVDHSSKAEDIMSLKDLCTIEHIPDLIEAGITSFKIEGRMKQPSYVAAVTSMYRKYVDLYFEKGRKGFSVSKEDKELLLQAYKRRGYCDGYYYRHNGKEMISFERPKSETESIWNGYKDDFKLDINGNLVLIPGSNAALYLEYMNIQVESFGDVVDFAQKQPMAEERIRKQIMKTGNTAFRFESLDIYLGDNVFIPVQSLNELRRNALLSLEQKMLETYRRDTPEEVILCKEPMNIPQKCEKNLTALVETLEQLKSCIQSPYVAIIYVEDYLYHSKYDLKNSKQIIDQYITLAHEKNKQIYFAMARIFRDEAKRLYDETICELENKFDGALARNLEEILYLENKEFKKPIVGDASMYQWNKSAKNFWSRFNLERTTAPIELNYHELKELSIEDMEFISYGYLPVMITAGCIQKHTKNCIKNNSRLELTDRYQKKFLVKNICSYCYNVIYNTSPVMLADQTNEIYKLNPTYLRLQFTVENNAQTEELLDLYGRLFIEGEHVNIPEMEFTRGHFKRGVK